MTNHGCIFTFLVFTHKGPTLGYIIITLQCIQHTHIKRHNIQLQHTTVTYDYEVCRNQCNETSHHHMGGGVLDYLLPGHCPSTNSLPGFLTSLGLPQWPFTSRTIYPQISRTPRHVATPSKVPPPQVKREHNTSLLNMHAKPLITQWYFPRHPSLQWWVGWGFAYWLLQ